MKNLFNRDTVEEIVARIGKLQSTDRALWGKMTLSQMMAHCQVPLEVAVGEKKLKRNIFGILFGRMAKKQMMGGAPFRKNLPTDKSFLIKDQRDFEKEKITLLELVKKFAVTSPQSMSRESHPFFGKMAPEEWGILSFRHLDHHLMQFGV